jgi:hypothetical protein
MTAERLYVIALAVCRFGDAYGVVGLDEGVVHGDDVDIVVLNRVAEDNATWRDNQRMPRMQFVYHLPMRPKPLIPTLTTMIAKCCAVECQEIELDNCRSVALTVL